PAQVLFQEDYYGTIWEIIGTPGQHFANTIRPQDYIDNGAGLEWPNVTLSPFTMWRSQKYCPVESVSFRPPVPPGVACIRVEPLLATSARSPWAQPRSSPFSCRPRPPACSRTKSRSTATSRISTSSTTPR